MGSHQPSRQHDDFLSTVDALATSLTATSPATMPQSAELHTEARTMHGWKNSGRMDINSRIQTSGDEPWLGCVLLFTALLFAVSLSSSAFLTTPCIQPRTMLTTLKLSGHMTRMDGYSTIDHKLLKLLFNYSAVRPSCSAVYCNRSCLWVCYHDKTKSRSSIFTKLGL